MIRRFVRPLVFAVVGISCVSVVCGRAAAHPEAESVRIETPVAELAGTLLTLHSRDAIPCCVLVGGTLSQDRDGRFLRTGVPPRDALKRWAEALAAGGYASLRYDPVGRGSRPTSAWTGTYRDEARALAKAVEFVRQDRRFNKIVVVGESAGGYVACLATADGMSADAFVFLGAFCGESAELYDYNFGRLAQYVQDSPERLAWAQQHCRQDLALGRHYREMLAAAAAGQDSCELVDGDFQTTVGGLARRREELALSPEAAFRTIRQPALALAGEHDRNVPASHAQRAAELMRAAGNARASHQLIGGVDHSFQRVPAELDVQIRERYELTSFRRPYEAKAYHAVIDWLRDVAPTSAPEYPEQIEWAAARATPPATTPAPSTSPNSSAPPQLAEAEGRAQQQTEVDAKTEFTPERLFLAPGIEIIPDITDRAKTAGVETLEGRIGPLILGSGSQAHFIEMPSGMYVEEHPHSSESLIYTVRGQWVLCSEGRRQLMKAGSLFRFAANRPTGYEVPFGESAYILIFKGDRLTRTEADFIQYLRGMAERLQREQRDGVPYLLRDLPTDHAARVFARKVNPQFERQLGGAPQRAEK